MWNARSSIAYVSIWYASTRPGTHSVMCPFATPWLKTARTRPFGPGVSTVKRVGTGRPMLMNQGQRGATTIGRAVSAANTRSGGAAISVVDWT